MFLIHDQFETIFIQSTRLPPTSSNRQKSSVTVRGLQNRPTPPTIVQIRPTSSTSSEMVGSNNHATNGVDNQTCSATRPIRVNSRSIGSIVSTWPTRIAWVLGFVGSWAVGLLGCRAVRCLLFSSDAADQSRGVDVCASCLLVIILYIHLHVLREAGACVSPGL